MSERPTQHAAVVTGRQPLSDHLVRLTLNCPGLVSTGILDEWVALTVPGQFQTRYYTLRRARGPELTLDVVIHARGLVTEWAQTDCVGDVVGLGPPRGSYLPPADARWVVLVGDLTALPAMARIGESERLPVETYVEAPEGTETAYPDLPGRGVTFRAPPVDGDSALAELVRGLTWPEGPGYFWMAGESAQMREVRRHIRQVLGMDSRHHDAMGYWSGARGRRMRAVDPAPIYDRGKRAGKSDEEIWADYDRSRGEDA